jgi:hypothetical protein
MTKPGAKKKTNSSLTAVKPADSPTVSIAVLPEIIMAAISAVGKDGRGTGSAQGYVEYAAASPKHRAQIIDLLGKLAVTSARSSLPSYGSATVLMRGYSIHDSAALSNPREEYIRRILGIASRMYERPNSVQRRLMQEGKLASFHSPEELARMDAEDAANAMEDAP